MSVHGKLATLVVTAAILAGSGLFGSGCSGNGGDGVQTIVVRLGSDEDCFGLIIEVSQAGLDAGDRATAAACTADPEILALGCQAEVDAGGNTLTLSADGCFAPDGTALFQCVVRDALAERFQTALDMRCGCGCAEECPAALAALVCDADGEDCVGVGVDAGSVVAAADGTSRSTTVVPAGNPTSSSTTFCGTCCDAGGIDTGVALDDDVEIREIRFDLAMPVDEPHCPDFEGCEAAAAMNGPHIIDIDGDSIHVCLSAEEAVEGPLHLFSCSVTSDGTDTFQISNVTALDENLRPINPPPPVVNDGGD